MTFENQNTPRENSTMDGAETAANVLGSVPGETKKSGGVRLGIGNFRATLDLSQATIPTKREHFISLFLRHKHKTLAYCSVFWSFGMGVSFLGPTLLDLGCKTGRVLADVSWVFFIQALFILLGSASAGLFLKKISAEPVLVISTVMIAVTLSIIPMCSELSLLGGVLAVMGFFMGIIDTTANASMVALFGQDVSPFIHALHFCYGLGAFVSPMIAKPFLLNMDCSPFITNNTVASHDLLPKNISYLPAQSLEEAQKITQVNYAFWIMSVLQIPVIILVISLVGKQCFMNKGDLKQATGQFDYSDMDEETKGSKTKIDNSSINIYLIIALTVLACLIVSCYDGLQVLYADYIYSYAVEGASSINNKDAAYLSACFWGFFAFGRLISVAIATVLTPACMLFINITGCTLSLIVMLIGGNNESAIYLGTCSFGLFMSSVFPTSLSWLEQYLNVNTIITSILVLGAASGEMCFPVIVGQSFETGGPTFFLVFALVTCLASYGIYIGVCMIGHTILRNKNSENSIGVLSICVRKGNEFYEDSGFIANKQYNESKSPDKPLNMHGINGDNHVSDGHTDAYQRDKSFEK